MNKIKLSLLALLLPLLFTGCVTHEIREVPVETHTTEVHVVPDSEYYGY